MHRFYYSDLMMQYNMGPQHPLRPIRLQMTLQMLQSYGLTKSVLQVTEPELADADEVCRTHSVEFLEALSSIDRGRGPRNPGRFGLGTGDNPIFAGIYDASLRYSGGSIQAAQAVIDAYDQSGEGLAFNISGGLHHAHYDKAAGFCVLNDCALAVRRLRTRFQRVAYVDIDVHHGDGVQELFYDDPSVLTVSIHELAHGFFPGTGHVWETGEKDGLGCSVNVPVAPYTSDDTWITAWRNAALPILTAYNPEAIVLQMGADPHYLDPLAHVCLTAQGWLTAIEDIKALGKPIVAIGGGGYNLSTVPRMWTLAIAALCSAEISDSVPESYAYRDKMPTLRDQDLPRVSPAATEQARAFAISMVEDVKNELFEYHGL